ncbi:MAG: GNAT family N-acetyltransferase [Acidimicrobiales bacterium]
MSVHVREFHRDDREQLTALVNLHVSTVLPGVALSTNVVLNQLEREPGEIIVDPWVEERRCLVAIADEAVVGAVLVHRFSGDERVGEGYRSAAEIRWLVFAPAAADAGRTLLRSAIELARGWDPTTIHALGSLPAPGCYGVPDSWPHVRQALVDAGFVGPSRTELVVAARCEQLRGHRIEGADVARSVGRLGTRIDLLVGGDSLGYIEFGEADMALARSSSGAGWTDIGNLFPTDPDSSTTVMPALLSAAADWLSLGGVDRLIDYYAADVHEPEYLAILSRLGFERLSTNERGWELIPPFSVDR